LLEARVAMGVAAQLFWQAANNAGTVMGLLPVVGVSLPLISYGGSSALTCLVGVGLLASHRRLGVTPPVSRGDLPAQSCLSTACRTPSDSRD
jgi:hypothetical protein